MSEIKLVIFDCDGVLVDSEYLAARHEAHSYAAFGLDMPLEHYYSEFAGMTGEAVFHAVEAKLGRKLPNDLLERIENELDDILKAEVEMIEGADTVLGQLVLPRCICSNSSSDRLRFMLQKTGLYEQFRPFIFSAHDLDPYSPKPEPDIFLKALSEFAVCPAEAIVIEDSVHGVSAAQNAGTRVVGFTGGRHSYPTHGDRLIEAGAETVLASFSGLPAVIAAFSQWSGVSTD